jgi:hypothetical protein
MVTANGNAPARESGTSVFIKNLRVIEPLLRSNKSETRQAVRAHWRGPEMRQGGPAKLATSEC